jgi:hypothetical protein
VYGEDNDKDNGEDKEESDVEVTDDSAIVSIDD